MDLDLGAAGAGSSRRGRRGGSVLTPATARGARGAPALALAAALVAASGCIYSPAGSCESQKDCAAGEQCRAGVCVLPFGIGGQGKDPSDSDFALVLWSPLDGQDGVTFSVDSVGADPAGGVVVAGAVDAAYDFGPGADDAVGAGAFVLKRSIDDGTPLWALSFPTFEHGRFDTAVLPNGDVLFAGTAFDPTVLGSNAFVPGAAGALILGRLDAITREPVWARAIDDTHASADVVPVAVAASGAGHLLVAGAGSGDFGCPSGDTAGETFAAALDGADGTCLWSRGFGTRTISDLEPRDGGDVAVAGLCTPAGASFDPGGAICTSGVFVAALSGADGTTSWLQTSSGAGTVFAAHDLAVAPDGSVTVVGDAKGVLDFGTGPSDFGFAAASFAATWSSTGAPTRLLRPIESPYDSEPDALAFSRCVYDRNGQLWIGGTYVGQPTLGGIRFTACRAPACGAAAFLAALDQTGSLTSFLPIRAEPNVDDGAWVADLVLFATTDTVASALRFTGAGMERGPAWPSSGGALGVLRVVP